MRNLSFCFILFFVVTAVCCSKSEVTADLIPQSNFDSIVDGKSVSLYTISNGPMTMQVTNFGGRVVSLFVPDRNGSLVDVVLGHDSLRPYIEFKRDRLLGAAIGPVANRICGGHFTIDGVTYELDKNHGGKGTLHSGLKGMDLMVWDVKEVNDSSITLHIVHPDGFAGFPGNLEVDMRYSLTSDASFTIDYLGTTDKTCPVNMTNHSYFNLSGKANDSINTHVLQVNADYFTGLMGLDVLEDLMPVEGTALDFRKPHCAGDVFDADDGQILQGSHGIDHNYCINGWERGKIVFDGSLYYPANGILMEVFSDQPGLQICTGQYSTGADMGKYGRAVVRHSAIMMETQNWPDAPNKDSFPEVLLHPGEKYVHKSIYRFSVR